MLNSKLVFYYFNTFIISIQCIKEPIEFRWIEQKLDHFHKDSRTFKMVTPTIILYSTKWNTNYYLEIHGEGRLFQAKWYNIFLYGRRGHNFIAYNKCFKHYADQELYQRLG